MRIPFFKLNLAPNTVKFASDAVRSKDWSGGMGEYCFWLADYLKTMYGKRHCILVNSGTSACRASLAAASGDPDKHTVIVPNYSCAANIMPVYEMGKKPVFTRTGVYGNPRFPEGWELTNYSNVAAMFCPYIYGQLPNGIAEFAIDCKREGIVLIADISQALGIPKESVHGDIVVGSLRTEKFLGCGEGGFLLTDDSHLYDRALRFCERGKLCNSLPYTCTQYGDNLLMPNVTAAIAYGQTEVLHENIYNKLIISEWYRRSEVFNRKGSILPGTTGPCWQTMFVNERMLASDMTWILGEHGVDSRPGFYPLSYIWEHCTKTRVDFNDAVGETLWKHGVVMPTPYGLTTEEFFAIEQIVDKHF